MKKIILILTAIAIAFTFLTCKEDEKKKPDNQKKDVDYVLSDITKEIGADWEYRISEIVIDSIITLSSRDGVTLPKVGEILIKTEITENFPYGFLGKVIEVKQEGSGAKIITESVSLEEAFEELDIHFSENISEYAIGEYGTQSQSRQLAKAMTTAANNNEIFLELSLKSSDSSNIKAEGKVRVALNFDFDMKINQRKLTYLNAAVNPKFQLSADFTISVSGKSKYEVELADIPFAAIPVGALVIVPKIKIYAVIGTDGKVELQTKISYSQTASYGVKYQDDAFSPYVKSTSDNPFNAEAIFSIDGKLYVGTRLALLCSFYGTNIGLGIGVTPQMGVSARFEMNVNEFANGGFYNACKQSKLKASIYLNGDIFVMAKIFSKTLAKYQLYTPEYEFCTLFEKYLLPHFSDFRKNSPNNNTATLQYSVPNDIFIPANVGMAVYDNQTLVDKQFKTQTHSNATSYGFTFTGLETGKTYTAVPLVKFGVLPDITAAPSFSFSLEEDKEQNCQDFDNEQGIVINGVRWATRNVDAPGTFASSPCAPGMLYQWNSKVGWPATGEVTGWYESCLEGDSWAKANDPSPAGWRVPTFVELRTLLDTDKVTSEWITINSVAGRKFIDKATSNTIFLPAVGIRPDGTLYLAGEYGRYWSSTMYEFSGVKEAYTFSFGSSSVLDWHNHSPGHGFSVRSVAE